MTLRALCAALLPFIPNCVLRGSAANQEQPDKRAMVESVTSGFHSIEQRGSSGEEDTTAEHVARLEKLPKGGCNKLDVQRSRGLTDHLHKQTSRQNPSAGCILSTSGKHTPQDAGGCGNR